MTGKQQTRIYKNRWFAKYASREGISDAALIAAVDQAPLPRRSGSTFHAM